MNTKAVVFDLDGTLADTIPLTLYSLREVLCRLTGNSLSDEEIIKEFGITDIEIIRKFAGEELWGQGVELYIKHFSDHFHQFIKPIEGIKALLKYIQANGIKTAIFTGRSFRVTQLILQKLDIIQYFSVVIAGDHTVRPKPAPEGILMALDRLQVQPEESIYVGDFDVDIDASRAAGTMSVLALWSSTGSEKLIGHKPDLYFRSPYDFLSWLEENVNVQFDGVQKVHEG